MFDKLPQWLQNKWALFGLSFGAGALVFSLLFFVILRGPIGTMMGNRAERSAENGNYLKAADQYETALRLKKNKEALYLGYCRVLGGMGDFDKAHQVLDQGIRRLSGAEALYLAKARLYTQAGEIGAAADFLSNISNSYINKKVQAERPADLVYSPAQGSYTTTQKVTITLREGETVYYTLNGEDPTLQSPVYSEPITVGADATLTAISYHTVSGLVSPRLQITYKIDNADETIRFADPKMERMVQAALGGNRALKKNLLASVTDLNNAGIEGQLMTLEDLQYLPNLKSLRLVEETMITDYTPLAGLKELTALSLTGCGLSDSDLTVIAGCTKLTELELSGNQLTTLAPLRPLVYLEFLNVADNEIASSQDLAAFPLLSQLNVAANRLCELDGLQGAEELVSLTVSNNYISDLSPICKLPKLTELYLPGNTPNNIKKLSSLPQLKCLDLSGCGLTSLSVVNDCKSLTVLFATDNEIASLGTFTLPVTELYISENPLVDLSPLQGRAELSTLEIAQTKIKDLAPLRGLPELVAIDLTGAPVKSLEPLANCPKLGYIYCSKTASAEGLPERIEIVYQQ